MRDRAERTARVLPFPLGAVAPGVGLPRLGPAGARGTDGTPLVYRMVLDMPVEIPAPSVPADDADGCRRRP